MLRTWLALAAAALTLALLELPSAATQTGGTTGTGGFTGGTSWASSDFFIGVQREQGANLSDFDVERFFNKARCDCDTPVYLYFTLSQAGIAKKVTSPRTGTISFWVGRDCQNTSLGGLEQRCKKLDSAQFSEFLLTSRRTITTDARVLSTDTSAGAATGIFFEPNPTCTLQNETYAQTIWAILDGNNDGTPDVSATRGVTIDLTAPPPPDPASVSAEGGDQALILRWEGVDLTTNIDLLGYQVLCNRAGSLQVFPTGSFEAGFESCPATNTGGGIAGLDPAFVCSPLLATTTRSFRIKILQNDIPYGAAVVAVDKRGNASAIDSSVDIVYEKPIRTKSFYDVYRDGDPDHQGGASGGFCAMAPERSSTRVGLGWALAGAAAAVAAVIARRRRRR
jgi:hypothetical protein